MSAKLIQVIETRLERRGAGSEGDPVRRILQYWTLDGRLLAEVDPVQRFQKGIEESGEAIEALLDRSGGGKNWTKDADGNQIEVQSESH